MTDRELLELAAKGAGIVVERSRLDDPACKDFLVMNSARNVYQKYGPWNPLTDDGDALRLSVDRVIEVDYYMAEVEARSDYSDPVVEMFREHPDRRAAVRRAIVRAAAEIGKGMP